MSIHAITCAYVYVSDLSVQKTPDSDTDRPQFNDKRVLEVQAVFQHPYPAACCDPLR